MTKPKPLDRRIQRTRQLLLDSLIALILEKGYEETTVQDIIDRANVGRSTFYAHFENKEQLLFSGHDAFTQSLSPKGHSLRSASSFEIFKELFQHAANNYALAKAMLGKGGGDLMLGRVQSVLENHFKLHNQGQTLHEHKLSLFAASFSAAIIGLLSQWLEMQMPFSVEYMSGASERLWGDFAKQLKIG